MFNNLSKQKKNVEKTFVVLKNTNYKNEQMPKNYQRPNLVGYKPKKV